MKKLYAVLCLMLILSCNHKEPRKITEEKVPERDSVLPAPLPKPAETDSIAWIRSKVERINTDKLSSRHFEFTCDELMKVDYFYRNDSIVKISVDFGTIGDTYAREDYYYDGGELIFMYELVEGGPACEGCITKHEYRYYIRDHKTILSLKDQQQQPCRKCEFPDSSRQYRLLNTSTAAEIKAAICR